MILVTETLQMQIGTALMLLLMTLIGTLFLTHVNLLMNFMMFFYNELNSCICQFVPLRCTKGSKNKSRIKYPACQTFIAQKSCCLEETYIYGFRLAHE